MMLGVNERHDVHEVPMTQPTVGELLKARGMTLEQLAATAALDERAAEAIVAGRYTTSPKQRERVAKALGARADEIAWGQSVEVDHLYGHGTQFGRSP
jgi:transcriptional regulator with XRE-family HTH domain